MRIHCFQHVAFENPGTILEWISNNNYSISYTKFYEADFQLPEMSTFDVLLVLGGFMNVNEEIKFPWLIAEKNFIKNTIDAGKKIVGICLGSQLISAVLGAKVYQGNEKEIGFFPVDFSQEALSSHFFNHFKNPYSLFHWHGLTFDLPMNAQLIASSSVYKNQSYIIDNQILAMQFHLEMNANTLQEMLFHDGDELYEKGSFIQNKSEIQEGFHYLNQNKIDLHVLLSKFLNDGI